MSKTKYIFFEIVRYLVIIVLSPFIAILYLIFKIQDFIKYHFKGNERTTIKNREEYEQN